MNKKLTIFIIGCIISGVSISGCLDQSSQEPSENEMTNYDVAAAFFTNLSTLNYNAAYNFFNQSVTQDFTVSQFKEAWEYYLETYGSFLEIQHLRNATLNGFDVVYANITLDKGYVVIYRLIFNDESRITGFWFDSYESLNVYTPPNYSNPDSFIEHNVTFGLPNWQLSGTLTIPVNATDAPAVILVHGSGPNDRDETFGPNKPFKDLAWGLATQGITVLRYDKRTYTYPEELAALTTFTPQEEVIDDALEAISFLQITTLISPSEIYILGHSLGAMLAPAIGSQTNELAGLIMLAAPARTLEDLILYQTTYLANLDGTIDANESASIQLIQEQVQKVKTNNISENEQVFNVYKSYWEWLNQYNQVSIAENLTLPMLFLQGKRDYQVTYEDDFLQWQDVLQSEPNTTFFSYDQLNHLFMAGEGQPTNTEYFTIGHVSSSVITDIATWLGQ